MRIASATPPLNLPTRWYGFDLLKDNLVRQKLVHGSDWPIISIPPIFRVGFLQAMELMRDPNWMRRDIAIKRELGFDDEYWQRGAKVLNLKTQT